MISSISGNHGDAVPRVTLPNNRVNKDEEDAFPKRLSEVSKAGEERFDVADLSTPTGLLREPMLLPTVRNVKELSADLSAKLAGIFSRAGMEATPSVEFAVDLKNGSIRVKSDTPDAQTIEELVKDNSEVMRLFQTINAISSHAYEMPKHLKFQREYLASNNPEQVVAKYSSLFGRQSGHDISMVFDGSTIRMLIDGRNWNFSPNGPVAAV